MKALIFYDDVACAANTTAVLQRVAQQAEVTVKWVIRPWRLSMLKPSRSSIQALRDATHAHLIVFAVRRTSKFPGWTMDWLEQWAAIRYTPDAALAIIGDGIGQAPPAQAVVALSQFARRHGLSFIHDRSGIDDKPALLEPGVKEGAQPSFTPGPSFGQIPTREGKGTWDLNI